MIIQAFADSSLVYDSRLDETRLLGLTASIGENVGGTATIVMPPNHPSYSRFVSYRTVVTIYRDGVLLFRGRALYPSDDFSNRRTVTCEGERCMLYDAVVRPYLYQTTPESIFRDLITKYNAQTDAFKRFTVGEVTVTDPNGYVRLESESAEHVSAVLDKLVERCGGYVVFSGPADARVINWYAEYGNESGQSIDFGENLTDFARSDAANTELATRLVPYGAKDEETGKRVTIESVNGGRDYIEDEDAVALRGIITATATWDDVTLPANLLTSARRRLDSAKLLVTSLTLSAVDLSILDKDIDSFAVGDYVRVRSAPHGVNESFRVTARDYNLLQPTADRVSMGKQTATLSGAGAAASKASSNEIQRETQSIRAELIAYSGESTAALDTLGDITDARLRHLFELLADFGYRAQAYTASVDTDLQAHVNEISDYVRIDDNSVIIGGTGNEIRVTVGNTESTVEVNGVTVGTVRAGRFTFAEAETPKLLVGGFELAKQPSGNITFRKAGESL